MEDLTQNSHEQNGAIVQNSGNSGIRETSQPSHLWKPGQSGNPLGRPKSKHVTEAYKAILEEKGADSLAETVWDDAHNATKPSDRLAAIQEITDRVEGKAVQTTNVRGIIAMVPAESVMGALDSWAEDPSE